MPKCVVWLEAESVYCLRSVFTTQSKGPQKCNGKMQPRSLPTLGLASLVKRVLLLPVSHKIAGNKLSAKVKYVHDPTTLVRNLQQCKKANTHMMQKSLVHSLEHCRSSNTMLPNCKSGSFSNSAIM